MGINFNVSGDENPEKLRRVADARFNVLSSFERDPFMGAASLEEALEEAKFTSQSEVLARLLNRESLFISGLAGSGKTTVINKFIEVLDAMTKGEYNIAITASTGIAATHLNGQTIHSWAGLGISTEPHNKYEKVNKTLQQKMKETDILIIDEISMVPAYLFTKLDEKLKHYRNSKEPFGGLQLILMGDFLQLPPVNKGEIGVDCRFAIETDAWQAIELGYCFLDKTHRAKDPRLKMVLQDITKGEITHETRQLIDSRINVDLDPEITYTRLFTTNLNVDNFNLNELRKNPNPEIIFPTLKCSGNDKDFEKLKKKYNLPNELVFKVGATVILTKNMKDHNLELIANGTIGKIVGVSKDLDSTDETLLVKFNKTNAVVRISPTLFEETEKVETIDPVTNKRSFIERPVSSCRQYPLKLGYAITVHKSQGAEYNGVILDLSKCFTPGLGYVALSRVSSIDDLVITGFSEEAYSINAKSQRISVYVKKKAYRLRKEFREDFVIYESLLLDPLMREAGWGPKERKR